MYSEMFARVIGRLKQCNISVRLECGKVVTERDIAWANESLGFDLPHDLVDFYYDMGDGVHFTWVYVEPKHEERMRRGESTGREVYGCCSVSALEYLIDDYRGAEFMDSGRFVEGHEGEYRLTCTADERDLMRSRIRRWVPFIDLANGDYVCIDTQGPGQPVVFYALGWPADSEVGHGHIMAPSYREFMKAWSRVCFQRPSWWVSAYAEDGIDWDGPEFDKRFVLPSTP